MKYNRLGFVDTIVKAASAAVPAMMGPGRGVSVPGATPGQPIPGGAVPAPAAGPTTVSPVMQQAFTPQFSPVMQMAQDSPGLTQAAAPTQTATPSQAAKTGVPVPGTPTGEAYPGAYPGSDFGDFGPRPRGPAFPESFRDPFSQPVIQQEDNMQKLLTTGLIAVAAIGAINVIGRNRRNGNRKKAA